MNIVYNASAGTGKTYQVTRLYEELVLEEGIDPRDILLMTFTDNAAAELRMRVSHRLLKARRTAETEGNDEQIERAITASSRLASAPIGTIHSFCTRLLREHALEAGLSPGFAVLVGDERDELLNQICRDELLARLVSDSDFKAFCTGVQVISAGRGFGSSISETVPNLIAQAGSLGIALENAQSLLPDPLPPVSTDEFHVILNQLKALPNPSNKVKEATKLLGECIVQGGTACQVVDRFDQQFSGHFSYGDAQAIYPEFKALKEETRDRQRYRERFPAAKAFARYVESVAQCFQQRKHEMNTVDFDDQLRVAAQMLESGRIAPAFRYLIIDEVQDTSRIQCDIIRSLWNGDTRLVICGDRKQSIYTWRGADPQVMPDLEKAILDAGGKEEHLQTSYRSKAPILDVMNRLFATVYGPDDYPDHARLIPHPGSATTGEKACVEFLAPDEEEMSKQDKVEAEMEAIANRIRLLVDGPADWQPVYRHDDTGFEKTASTNRYRYSDILILLRRTTHQPALEQALRNADIAYTQGGRGRGLFTRQETRDVSLFLNVLTNPGDPYSLIGFLRSPWIGLSDEDIAELACRDGKFSINHLIERYGEKTGIIDRYRALLGTRLASELVRMLIDETGYDALLAGLPRGTQRLANLRKVLDWLRETERGAQTTAAVVARKLADRIANPPQIPEAALLDPAQNAVTIMTVHGAKGLTRRVVFVPDMSFSDQGDRSFAQVFFDEQDHPALGLRITAPDRSRVMSPGFKKAVGRTGEIRRHESDNLFYVAMTRARDLVVTSASPGEKPAGWYEKMQDMIGHDVKAVPYSLLRSAVTPPATPFTAPPTAGQLAEALMTLAPASPPPVLQRIAATRLAREEDEIDLVYSEQDPPAYRSATTSAAVGSLGHAVLEQLAMNHWEGSIETWLDILRADYSVTKKAAAALAPRIVQVCDLMISLTREMEALHPELPFVLYEDGLLIDGTIDLLCRSGEVFTVYDYKFTETDPDKAVDQYRGQLEIYRKAGEKLFPDTVRSRLILIVISSDGVRTIDCSRRDG